MRRQGIDQGGRGHRHRGRGGRGRHGHGGRVGVVVARGDYVEPGVGKADRGEVGGGHRRNGALGESVGGSHARGDVGGAVRGLRACGGGARLRREGGVSNRSGGRRLRGRLGHDGHRRGARAGLGARALRGAAHAGVRPQEGHLLGAQVGEGAGVDVLRKDGELAALERGVDHKANQRLAHERIALLLGFGGHVGGRLEGDLLVKRPHERIVGGRDEHGVQGGRGVHAVDLERLVFHLAGRALGQLLEREGLGVALRRLAENGADAALELIKEAHQNPRLPGPGRAGL